MSLILLFSWLPSIAPGQTTAGIVQYRPTWKPTSPDLLFVPRPVNVSVQQLLPINNQTLDVANVPVIVMILWNLSIPIIQDHQAFVVSKFEITYQPVNARYRVIVEVPGYKRSVTLDHLYIDTVYKCTVAAIFVKGNHRSKSVAVKFYTSRNVSHPGKNIMKHDENREERIDDGMTSEMDSATAVTVRNEEIIIVTGVLIFWVVVIILFINKWGKIRMLEPYQPQYKQSSLAPLSPVIARSSKGDINAEPTMERSRGVEVPKVMAQVHEAHPAKERYRHRQSSVSIEHSFSQEIISRRAKSAENLYDGYNVQFSM